MQSVYLHGNSTEGSVCNLLSAATEQSTSRPKYLSEQNFHYISLPLFKEIFLSVNTHIRTHVYGMTYMHRYVYTLTYTYTHIWPRVEDGLNHQAHGPGWMLIANGPRHSIQGTPANRTYLKAQRGAVSLRRDPELCLGDKGVGMGMFAALIPFL